jgi:hypothetical protein
MGQKLTAEKRAIRGAKKEVDLTRKLLSLLETPVVSVFFRANLDRDWYGVDALTAWEMWLPDMLSKEELAMYEENYAYEFSDIDELRNQLSIDSNRIPSGWNADGY